MKRSNQKETNIITIIIGGNEKHQIYYTEVGKGRATLLTDGVSKYTSLTWSKCGKFFAFCSTKVCELCVCAFVRLMNPCIG